jgi:two-component system, NarL family, sensor kinase
MKIVKNKLSPNSQLGKSLLIGSIFIIIATFEYCTPIDYVFGYLYCGVILLVNSWFGEVATFKAIVVAVCLTVLNIWIPGGEIIKLPILTSRIVAAIALILTGFLSQRLRRSQETIAKAEVKLEAQEKLVRLREDFASTLTHDLKTPLLGAIETIKAFQEEKFGSVTKLQQEVLATMARSHGNSLHLVETLLDIYRNDTEGLKLNLAPINLVVIVEDVARELRSLAANRRIYLELGYGGSEFRRELWVLGDNCQLRRVFGNLLINAINHSPRGGHVEVILESQTSYQVVKILDTGVGIKTEEFSMLFNKFYQGDSERCSKGSGLGLYLSRQIIEAHGGIIWAENRVSTNNSQSHLVSGAIFGFKLPVHLVQTT